MPKSARRETCKNLRYEIMNGNSTKKPPSRLARVSKWAGIATSSLIVLAALIRAGGDVLAALQHLPTTPAEKQNRELFEAHFKESPVKETNVAIELKRTKITMLLDVYSNGDIYVSYAGHDQWFPFVPPMQRSAFTFSLIPNAYADPPSPAAPEAHENKGESNGDSAKTLQVIDISKLIQEQTQRNSKADTATLSRSYLIATMKDDHPSFFSPSSKVYKEVFHANPGYEFTSFKVRTSSDNNARILGISNTGSDKITVTYKLTSGPIVDQWRGWLKAELKTEQKLKK